MRFPATNNYSLRFEKYAVCSPHCISPLLGASFASRRRRRLRFDEVHCTMLSSDVLPFLLDRQVRQYFRDSEFYVTDLEARGLCSSSAFLCEEFDPSAATVKVGRLPTGGTSFKSQATLLPRYIQHASCLGSNSLGVA